MTETIRVDLKDLLTRLNEAASDGYSIVEISLIGEMYVPEVQLVGVGLFKEESQDYGTLVGLDSDLGYSGGRCSFDDSNSLYDFDESNIE